MKDRIIKNRRTLRTLLFIIFFILFLTICNFKLQSNDFYNGIIIFISIVTGFNITALSIIATSPFSKSLYKLEYKYDNSKTLLHILVAKFKFSTVIYLLTIGMCLLYLMLKDYIVWDNHTLIFTNYSFIYPDIVKAFTLSFTLFSFGLFFETVVKFADFVIQSAKSDR